MKKQIQQKMKEILHSLFYDVSKPIAYTSRRNVYRAASRHLPSITLADAARWFKGQLSHTLYKPTHIHFAHNKTIVKSIDDQWKADLCDMQSKAKHYDGKTFILTCIDCFWKLLWAETLQQKTTDDIIKALKRILDSGRKSKRFQSECRSEFTNKMEQAFLRKHNILFFTTNKEQKANIVERFNRKLKTQMFK